MVDKDLSNIKIKKYQRWNYTEILEEVENDIKKLDYDLYIIVQPQEYYYRHNVLFDRINKLLSNKKSNLMIYIGSEFDINFNNNYDRIEFIKWDSIDYFSKAIKFRTIINSTPDEQVRFYEYLKYFPSKKMFTSLINVKVCRFWRLFLINEFFKYDLISNGNFSIRFDRCGYDHVDALSYWDEPFIFNDLKHFKINNWSPNNMIFTDKKNSSDDLSEFELILHPTYLKSTEKFMANNICDFEYMICAFDIVIETIYDYFFVTEKTLRPIDAKKPFLVFSGVDYHKNLRDKYGFKLFDNIIDYSFDDEINTTIRWKKQMDELIKIKNYYTPDQINYITRENVHHNYNNLLKIRNNNIVTDIPEEYIKYNNENFYEQINNNIPIKYNNNLI